MATRARTFFVGEPPAEVADLIDTTRLAHAGRHRRGRARATTSRTSRPRSRTSPGRGGYGIVRQFVGHGIGTEMHEEPQVPNFRTGRPGRKLEPGLCLAIEPMFTLGRAEARVLDDDWTVVTRDGSLAAHFEDSIAITEHGPEILTAL